MSVRLAFAVTVEVDADVLLIDEVLAVGDAAFQQKCFEQFEQLKRDGPDDRARHARHVRRRALLRPRDADRPRQACSRIGDPHEIALAYNELNFGRLVEGDADRRGPLRRPARRPRSRPPGSRTTPASGSRSCAQGEPCTIVHGGPLPRARWRSRSSPSTCATSRATSSSRPPSDWRGEPVGQLRRRRDRARAACASRTGSRRTATRSARRSRAPARATTCVDLREDLAALRRARHARDRRRSPTCRTTFAVERA